MKQRGQFTATLFCVLCIGGVVTLFSQAEAKKSQFGRTQTHNVPSAESRAFKKLIPAGTSGGTYRARDAQRKPQRDRPQRLTLR